MLQCSFGHPDNAQFHSKLAARQLNLSGKIKLINFSPTNNSLPELNTKIYEVKKFKMKNSVWVGQVVGETAILCIVVSEEPPIKSINYHNFTPLDIKGIIVQNKSAM